MSSYTQHSARSRYLLAIVILLFAASSAMAEDMWEGVFAYQKKMADYGNAEAQVKLGEMYENGHGTEQDFNKAEEWYRKAAGQGFEPANKKLAGLEQRRKKAAEAKQRAEQERIARKKAEARREAEAADRARLERQREERLAREAEQRRLAAEKAAQEAEDKVRKAEAEAKDKARKAEEEQLARKRAKEAIKKMLATPDAYAEE